MFRVLIVEDNSTYRRIVKDNLCLSFPSIIVEEAEDGKVALEKAKAFLPHLIFMDINLPGENGLQVARKIKLDYPEMVIIILTSYDLPEYRQAAIEYGASDFITKDSFNMEDVQKLLTSMNFPN